MPKNDRRREIYRCDTAVVIGQGQSYSFGDYLLDKKSKLSPYCSINFDFVEALPFNHANI